VDTVLRAVGAAVPVPPNERTELGWLVVAISPRGDSLPLADLWSMAAELASVLAGVAGICSVRVGELGEAAGSSIDAASGDSSSVCTGSSTETSFAGTTATAGSLFDFSSAEAA